MMDERENYGSISCNDPNDPNNNNNNENNENNSSTPANNNSEDNENNNINSSSSSSSSNTRQRIISFVNDTTSQLSQPRVLKYLAGGIVIMCLSYRAGKVSQMHARHDGEIISSQEWKVHNDDYLQSDGTLNAPGRICRLFHDRYSEARVIETSLSEPSRAWKEVSCLEYPPHLAPSMVRSGKAAAGAAAKIKVQWQDVAFPDRPPILGFGGAFTEAAALNYNSLEEDGKQAVMELLFGKSGLGYSLGRTHMNSCDFCVESYSFDDVEDDLELRHFDSQVQHDVTSGMVGMMADATAKAASSFPREVGPPDGPPDGPLLGPPEGPPGKSLKGPSGGIQGPPAPERYGMRIIASPWSPPAWMKAPTARDEQGAQHSAFMTGSAQPTCLRDGAGQDSEYAKSWALFFVKFITAYANHGIKFYGVTVQNEPEFPAPWDACSYDPTSEKQFVQHHLGPALSTHHPDTKLFIFDHNKDHVNTWAHALLFNNEEEEPVNATSINNATSQYIQGIAYHWYAGGMDRLLDGAQGTPNMHRLVSELRRTQLSNQIVLGSEACHCPSTGYAGGDLNIAWARATRNAHSILADLAAGSNGFIEWNLILDSVGGPNHLGNMCDAPLLAVPHRSITNQQNNKTIPPQLDFEHAGHPFGKVHGDGKTREELNAIGSPAKYLDLGIVIQPMYYYVGHISKFVRPGSRAVHSIVDDIFTKNHHTHHDDDDVSIQKKSSSSSSKTNVERIFRPKYQTVAGGGINDLARNGIEITLWPCEGSTRQSWTYNNQTNHRQLQVFGHDWLGVPTSSCISKSPDESMGGLLLTSCDSNSGVYDIVPTQNDDDHDDHDDDGHGVVNIVLTNSNVDRESSCLVVQPLRNRGGAYGPKGGAQVNIGNCSHAWAKWNHDTTTGEITSFAYKSQVCLTTGWPFLQVGAFDTTPNGPTSKTMIILNEAGESANYVVVQKDNTILMEASIPAHSIQTILLD